MADSDFDLSAMTVLKDTPVEPEPALVTLSLVGPFLVYAFEGQLLSGDKLTVNADGVRVSAADATELQAQAELAGVELRIGE